MKVLFARIGYMKYYRGPMPGDEKPIGGGKYNKKNVGHEAYNFKNVRGMTYGYFQPSMRSPTGINLSRISPGASGDCVEDVLVIWFAKDPVAKGQVIVGWHKNATVYGKMTGKNKIRERGGFAYLTTAKSSDCVLLPSKQRGFLLGNTASSVKRGNPGQANVFYIREANGKPKNLSASENVWIRRAIDFVNNYEGPSLESPLDDAQEEIMTRSIAGSRQGFGQDVKVRKWVENHAMKLATQHYRKQGYSVTDVSATCSYDLHARKGTQEILVEVKGTQAIEAQTIMLTRNEVRLSRDGNTPMALAIVAGIEVGKTGVKKSSGKLEIIYPWKADDHKLEALSYMCVIKR